jgi:hypothetical protein
MFMLFLVFYFNKLFKNLILKIPNKNPHITNVGIFSFLAYNSANRHQMRKIFQGVTQGTRYYRFMKKTRAQKSRDHPPLSILSTWGEDGHLLITPLSPRGQNTYANEKVCEPVFQPIGRFPTWGVMRIGR